MDISKVVILNRHLLPCILFLQQLVTISAQSTCTHLAANDGEKLHIKSPNYPSNYDSDQTKCWIIEAAYPTHKIHLETIDFHLAPELYCLDDYLEIRQGSSGGNLVGRFCSSQRPSVMSTGRTLYLRFVSDSTKTDRGFKLNYTSVEAPDDNDGSFGGDSGDDSSGTDWTVAPQLYLLITGGGVGFMFLICFITLIVAIKSDKKPKKKRTRQKRRPQPKASSQQELATHIQIEHTTHNESQSVYSTLEPTAPTEVPVHYGNANPSSHLETLPPSYTVAMRDGGGPYMAYGNDTFGMS